MLKHFLAGKISALSYFMTVAESEPCPPPRIKLRYRDAINRADAGNQSAGRTTTGKHGRS